MNIVLPLKGYGKAKFSLSDKELIALLHKLVFWDKDISKLLSEAFDSAYAKISEENYTLPYIAEDISIKPFRKKLPYHLQCIVNMCRVFILKKRMRFTSLENHRNSIQRLVSYKGSGTIYQTNSRKNFSFQEIL